MNHTYILALVERTAREAAFRAAAQRVAESLVADASNDLLVASPFASVRAHQNFFRRVAGLAEFPSL